MSNRNEGLIEKYHVTRLDGKPVGDCIVLEFDDSNKHEFTHIDEDAKDSRQCNACAYRSALAEMRQKLQDAQEACDIKDAALREAIEWNWLDEECDPPKNVVVQVNRALSL